MDKRQANNAFLSVNVQIRFRGTVYEFRLGPIIKWLGIITVMGYRLYRQLRGASP